MNASTHLESVNEAEQERACHDAVSSAEQTILDGYTKITEISIDIFARREKYI